MKKGLKAGRPSLGLGYRGETMARARQLGFLQVHIYIGTLRTSPPALVHLSTLIGEPRAFGRLLSLAPWHAAVTATARTT